MKISLSHSYKDIIGLNNLFSAWEEFLVGKSNKDDVQAFALNLSDNIAELHADLVNKKYRHGGYYSFYINDLISTITCYGLPKRRSQ